MKMWFLSKKRYRPCVGMVLFNATGEVFLAQRVGFEDKEESWQFPQGGIDAGESPEVALWRECQEEVGLTSDHLVLVSEKPKWTKYLFPQEAISSMPSRMAQKYRGQKQKWFLLYVKEEASDSIDLTAPNKEEGADYHQEFSSYRWTTFAEAIKYVVDFKKETYRLVGQAFKPQIQNFLDKKRNI